MTDTVSIRTALAMVACCFAPSALAAPASVADTPVAALIKKIDVYKASDKSGTIVSTFGLNAKPPKAGSAKDAYEAWSADGAWLLARYGFDKPDAVFTIQWTDVGRQTLTHLDRTRVKLPEGQEQAGPVATMSHSSHCAAGYTTSDEYGIVYRHEGGCANSISYAIPIERAVLKYLADRVEKSPHVPLSVTLEGDGSAGKPVQRQFSFFPAEARALLTKLDQVRTAAK